MNKFIILSILLFSIYCSFDSCGEETIPSQCKNHDIQFNGFSCYKMEFPQFIEDDEGDNDDYPHCFPYPDKSETQKKYRKFLLGYMKETGSAYEEAKNEITEIPIFKEETYSKDETLTYKLEKLSSEDKKILNGNKTCAYLMFGRYSDNIKKYRSGYPNIEDKNICINADQFSDLKGLINCGYAHIKYTIMDKVYNFSTCYYIPDNQFPEELKPLWRILYFPDEYILDILEMDDDDIYDKNIGNKVTKIFKKSKKRKLQDSEKDYEIIVEDKFGKKVKYSSNSTEMEILEKGDERATTSNKSTSIYQKINMLFGLLLLLIL